MLSIEALESIADNAIDLGTLKAIQAELSNRKTRAATHLSQHVVRRLAALQRGEKLQPASNPSSEDMFSNIERTSPKSVHTSQAQNIETKSIAPKPKFKPTDEQTASVDAFMTGQSLKVSAFAGAGKTSTLKLMAAERGGRGLYLAFNRKIADEARHDFPKTVDCRTTHSIAARAVLGAMGFGRAKMFDTIRARELAAVLELQKTKFGPYLVLNESQQAFLFLTTVKRFCQSADEQISTQHIPETGKLRGLEDELKAAVKEWIVEEARALWAKMKSAGSDIPLGHDGYLKLWSLGRPKLGSDYILLDEAQDTNPVVLSVLQDQDSQMVYVGDRHQQIYEWRGAVNAMELISTEHEAFLTQSFRFGNSIASEASKILSALGEKHSLTGNGSIASRINDIDSDQRVDAILARTNSSVIAETLSNIELGRSPFIVGGTQELERLVGDVFSLQKGEPGMHPDFFGFTSWSEVVEFSDTDEGEELKPFVSLVEKHGAGALWRAIKSSAPSEEASDLAISTTHKAKGLEWQSVQVCSDFEGSGQEKLPISEAEARLFYVAITRARQNLQVCPNLLNSFTSATRFASSAELEAARKRLIEKPKAAAGPKFTSVRQRKRRWFSFGG